MTAHFDQPAWLFVALLAVPLLVLAWRGLRALDAARRAAALALRAVLVVAIAVALAGPHARREHDQLTVIGLLDISGSVQRFAELPPLPDAPDRRATYLEHARAWFRAATNTKTPDDRFGLVVFDGEAVAISAPSRAGFAGEAFEVAPVPGTGIADAIRLGLAMFPADTARRLVLVSDGNETIGDALAAAREAIGTDERGLRPAPIDVVPVAYRVRSDVQIVSIETPSLASPGQTVLARVILEATEPTTGQLVLRREGRTIDLNGPAPGRARRVTLRAGRSAELVSVTLGDTPVNRFEAIFEADDPRQNVLLDNDRAEAFTATPGRGRVLIVDSRAGTGENLVGRILSDADLPVTVQLPGQLAEDLLSLQNFDLIVLDDVPAFELVPAQHELLARYVNDLGGGLIMIGGEHGFGAGGWNGTALEPVLPLELDPPKEMRLPQAALVLVLDQSGSMNRPVAGARATQQEVANEAAAMAIESVRAESLVGVVTFHTIAREYVPLERNDDPAAVARRVRRITAGGGTDLRPALRTAHRMLRAVAADRKRVVVLTDGQSPTDDLEAIVRAMRDDGIRLTTIAVGDEADHATLVRLAEVGEGEFYPVYNPKALPRVLVDSVQIVNKPLIKEVPFVPVVLPTGSSLTAGLEAAPRLGGLVVTAPRDDPRAVVEAMHPDGEPLLAHWQAGLGRVAAFTSDAGGPWSAAWSGWSGTAPFWTQLARMVARPPVGHDAELVAEVRDGRLHMVLEITGGKATFQDYLQVTGTVYGPDGVGRAVRLPQTAPGRYEASVPAPAPGNYIVALNPRRGTRRLAPVIGGASAGTGAEFRRYESDLGLLEQLVEITGGRRLDLARPESAALFDRTGMPVSISRLPLWKTIVLLAIGLLLLDVADRRIAWSAAGVRSAIARAVTRVAPGRMRGEAATATLASLRQVSDALDERVAADAAQVDRLPAPAPVAPPERVSAETSPEPSRVSAALDAILGRRSPRDEAAERSTPDVAPDDGPIDPAERASETTSSLLEAKRRARRRLGGGD